VQPVGEARGHHGAPRRRDREIIFESEIETRQAHGNASSAQRRAEPVAGQDPVGPGAVGGNLAEDARPLGTRADVGTVEFAEDDRKILETSTRA
jgi:hypothetical protein